MKIEQLWCRDNLKELISIKTICGIELTSAGTRAEGVCEYRGVCPLCLDEGQNFVYEEHPKQSRSWFRCNRCHKAGDVLDFFMFMLDLQDIAKGIIKFSQKFSIAPSLPRGIYKHYKGKLYRVEDFAQHSETSEWMVIYRQLYDKFALSVRPLEMFIEDIEDPQDRSITIPRFKLVWPN